MRIFLSFRLVLSQIRHEKLAFICLCIAISATLIPLLLILGLKNGTVETLRNRLTSDPANLEVKMLFSGTLGTTDIEKIASIPEAGFSIPGTRLLATSIMISSPHHPETLESNLVPTGKGDPLISRFDVPIPEGGQIILPQFTANQLKTHVGDQVTLSSRKRLGGKSCQWEKNCTVAGILPPESQTGVQIFVPLPIVGMVEEFLDGVIPVSDDGSAKQESYRLKPVFYGVHLNRPEIIEQVRPSQLSFTNPYREKTLLTEEVIQRAPQYMGTRPGLLLHNTGQYAGLEKIKKLYSLIVSSKGELKGWNPPLDLVLKKEGSPFRTKVYGELVPLTFGQDAPHQDKITLYSSDKNREGAAMAHIPSTSGDSILPVDVVYDKNIPAGFLKTDGTGLGLLHNARHIQVQWDESANILKKTRGNYARMRLYAKNIDSVEPLIRQLSSLGYKASGNIGGIAHVRKLNEQLQILFQLIAGIGIAGAVCALTLSLFNGAQKRKREYAILGTLGYPRHSLLLFPLFEAGLIVLCALIMSYSLFYGVAHIIQKLFSEDLYPNEKFCRLAPFHHVWIISFSLLTGCLASLVSSLFIIKVQPSTAIREI